MSRTALFLIAASVLGFISVGPSRIPPIAPAPFAKPSSSNGLLEVTAISTHGVSALGSTHLVAAAAALERGDREEAFSLLTRTRAVRHLGECVGGQSRSDDRDRTNDSQRRGQRAETLCERAREEDARLVRCAEQLLSASYIDFRYSMSSARSGCERVNANTCS